MKREKKEGSSIIGLWLYAYMNMEYKTSFWEDIWLGDIPLRLKYPTLYEYCGNKKATVTDFHVGSDWVISFTRSFNESNLESWECLLAELQQITLDDTGGSDRVSWGLEKSASFTTRSLYRFITHGGVVAKVDTDI